MASLPVPTTIPEYERLAACERHLKEAMEKIDALLAEAQSKRDELARLLSEVRAVKRQAVN